MACLPHVLAVTLLLALGTASCARVPGLHAGVATSLQAQQELQVSELDAEDDDSANAHIHNNRPIIGILALPGGEVLADESYISAAYVKWLESAGARVVPIMYDLSESELKDVFTIINGVLVPGGNYPLKPTTQWYKTASLLFEWAKEANDKGIHFPVHGTCLGLQLLVTLVTQDEYATSSVDAHDHPARLVWTQDAANSTFLEPVPRHVLDNFEKHAITMHNHHYGVLPEALNEYPELGAFYKVLAYTHDREGVQYATMLEGRKYPFTAFAFHPEKVPYDWTTSIHLPKTRKAMDAAYAMGQAVVEQARQNSHKGANVIDEDKHLIYNFEPLFSGRHEAPEDEAFFEQIYVFPKGQGYSRQAPRLQAQDVRA